MTLFSQGNGKLAARFQIVGMPYEAVTDAGMCKNTSDGRVRAAGLSLEGLVLEDRVDMARAECSSTPITAQIVDVQSLGDSVLTPWTKLFSMRPTLRCWLTVTATAADATLTVTTTAGFPASGVIYIDQETITYTGITGTTFTGCTRGAWDTVATYHYALDTTRAMAAEVTNWPITMEGRRARLFCYSGTDSLQGDGTQRWLGMLSSDARLGSDLTTWELQVDPITRLFQSPLGGDLVGPLPARGIYYNEQCCFYLSVYVSTDATVGNCPATPTWEHRLVGFYETQDTWVIALNAAIATHATTAATGLGLTAVADGTAGFHFELVTGAGANNRFVSLFASSPIDNVHMGGVPGYGPLIGSDDKADWGTLDTGTAAGARYVYPQAPGPRIPSGTATWGGGTFTDAVGAPGAVPRGSWASSYTMIPAPPGGRGVSFRSGGVTPATRIYIGGTGDISGVTAVTIDLGAEAASGTTTPGKVVALVSATGGASRYLDCTNDCTPGVQAMCWAGTSPTFTPSRMYVDQPGGTVEDLRLAIIASTPGGAPLGTAPYVFDIGALGTTFSDFATWSAVATAVSGRSIARRVFSSCRALKFGEVLQAEAQNIGCFLALDSLGRIALRQIGVAPTSTTPYTIDPTNETSEEQMGTWERNGSGSIGQVRIKTGYDQLEDKWTGPTFTFQSVTTFGRNPNAQTVEIAPKSCMAYAVGPMASDILPDYAQQAAALLGLFGYPYDLITVSVPFSLFAALCGDRVAITSKNLPGGNADRGTQARSGVIIGRRWDLANGTGVLTVFSSEINFAGYTPTGRVTAQVDNTGNNWTITIGTPAAGPTAGYSAATAFAVNDKVRVVRWDSTTSTIVTGTVQSTNGVDKITVQFTGLWTPGGGTWNVEYDVASAPWQTSQQVYCAIADVTDVITYSATTFARQFAP